MNFFLIFSWFPPLPRLSSRQHQGSPNHLLSRKICRRVRTGDSQAEQLHPLSWPAPELQMSWAIARNSCPKEASRNTFVGQAFQPDRQAGKPDLRPGKSWVDACQASPGVLEWVGD